MSSSTSLLRVINSTSPFFTHVTNRLSPVGKFGFLKISRPVSTSGFLHGKIIPFKLSDIGEGINEVTLKEWYVQEGDRVKQFDRICEVQSDKASVTITSRFDGVIARLHHEVEDVTKVGSTLVDIKTEEEAEGGDTSPVPSISQIETEETKIESQTTRRQDNPQEVIKRETAETIISRVSSRVLTTPAVRRLASEHKIDLSSIKGTGPQGRILKEDILQFLEAADSKMPSSDQRGQSISSPTKPQPASTTNNDTVEEIKGIQRAMVKSMTQSLQIPHFALAEEYNLTKLRQTHRKLKECDENLSLLSFIIKATSIALSQYPKLNATTDTSCQHITLHADHNIGVAIDTNAGLVVPNVKQVQLKSIQEINSEIVRLRSLAARNELKTEDFTSNTFTLSNIGSIGGAFGIPVIMAPSVAIGAIGRTRRLPVFKDEQSMEVVAADMATFVWSADHRVLDGATVTRFSNMLKSLLEDPVNILLHLK